MIWNLRSCENAVSNTQQLLFYLESTRNFKLKGKGNPQFSILSFDHTSLHTFFEWRFTGSKKILEDFAFLYENANFQRGMALDKSLSVPMSSNSRSQPIITKKEILESSIKKWCIICYCVHANQFALHSIMWPHKPQGTTRTFV